MFKELITSNTILVIGDFMLDSYWTGTVSRISPEAPVPVFQKRSSRSVAGGAANVVANLLASGKKVVAISAIGQDKVGEELKNHLIKIGCDCTLIQQSSSRRTTEKTRILAQNNQQLLRIDEEEIIWLTAKEENMILKSVEKTIQNYSAIVLSDYLKGVLTYTLCQGIIKLAKKNNVPVFCDVKDPSSEKYKGAYLLKPNKKELQLLTGMPVSKENEIREACRVLCHRCDNEYILVTLGSQGMALYTKSSDLTVFIQSEPKEVYDVSGAGDTVISYLAACVSSGMDIITSVKYSNKAAGIKVGKVGTATVTLDEMEEDIRKEELLNSIENKGNIKIQDVSGLLKILHNQPNKKVVFTNGCFDILHAGHVMYLEKAASCGDILIVGVNGDDSIRRLKGSTRPINTLSDRLSVLAGLRSVSYLVSFDEDTPEELIRTLKPDVLVKGSEYEGKFIAGADFVKENGGEVVLIPMLEGHSTTNIINKSGGSDHE